MKNLLKAALVFGCSVSGNAAFAAEHIIEILRYGYFPERVFVSEGDTITFVNKSPNWAYITSNNAYDNYSNYVSTDPCDYLDGDGDGNKEYSGSQDGWATNWIAKNASRSITVYACMEDEIEAPNIWQYNVYNSYNEAYIVFGSADTGS